jgi:hypothetical protein
VPVIAEIQQLVDSGMVEKLLALAEQSSPAWAQAAAVCSGLGDKDRAFELLEKALALRDDRLLRIKVDPRFDALRADERYKDFLRRMNLPQQKPVPTPPVFLQNRHILQQSHTSFFVSARPLTAHVKAEAPALTAGMVIAMIIGVRRLTIEIAHQGGSYVKAETAGSRPR